jgi:hypothetical protein
MNRIYIGLIVLAIIFGIGFYTAFKIFDAKYKRAENNFQAILMQQDSSNKQSMRELQLTVGEINRNFPELKKQIIDDFSVKLKQVVSVSNANTITTNNINTQIKDSVINDTVKVRVANYRDEWTDFHMLEIRDSVKVSYTVKDSLVTVVHRVPRKLGQWLRGEPKQVVQTIKSYNPNTRLTFNRYITIEK